MWRWRSWASSWSAILPPRHDRNTALEQQLEGQPEDIQDEIIRINTDARPLALQVALGIPILAALLGLGNSFRMMRQPDPQPSEAGEMVLGG